ncbi:hypothetical protein PIB30_043240 [Stylosanthes scabra]|uniref:RNase H type-1 domain-containing protein n=1 Tax=Stylosanthes scabra TaxID=79078 RepID=A0ABU6SG62_9FABA|nr:hypothetical protein [Stylosanthes scabra]
MKLIRALVSTSKTLLESPPSLSGTSETGKFSLPFLKTPQIPNAVSIIDDTETVISFRAAYSKCIPGRGFGNDTRREAPPQVRNNEAGCGGLIRSQGPAMLSGLEVYMAELVIVISLMQSCGESLNGLNLAWNLGMRRVQVEVDSLDELQRILFGWCLRIEPNELLGYSSALWLCVLGIKIELLSLVMCIDAEELSLYIINEIPYLLPFGLVASRIFSEHIPSGSQFHNSLLRDIDEYRKRPGSSVFIISRGPNASADFLAKFSLTQTREYGFLFIDVPPQDCSDSLS